jgi:enamine deaminase RidA (YjgF/YER057c/UK114 family)
MNNDSEQKPSARLAALGLFVPQAPGAVAAYEPWQRMGNIVTTSFQLPWAAGELKFVGRLGEALSIEEGFEAARICALNGIAQLQQAAGSLDRVRIVRIEGHVGCIEGFEAIPKVLDGGSELINAVFGERGRHARTAQGHAVMPLNVPVMLGFWAEIVG